MQNLIDQTCCFTGHRQLSEEIMIDLQRSLEKEIVQMMHAGICCFCAGGARGFDMLAESTVLRIKQDYPQVRLEIIVPVRGQAKNWTKREQVQYDSILQKADRVVCLSELYDRGCMQVRNRYLVNQSSKCICYLEKNTGGTKYTVDYALSKNLQVINLADCSRLQ